MKPEKKNFKGEKEGLSYLILFESNSSPPRFEKKFNFKHMTAGIANTYPIKLKTFFFFAWEA